MGQSRKKKIYQIGGNLKKQRREAGKLFFEELINFHTLSYGTDFDDIEKAKDTIEYNKPRNKQIILFLDNFKIKDKLAKEYMDTQTGYFEVFNSDIFDLKKELEFLELNKLKKMEKKIEKLKKKEDIEAITRTTNEIDDLLNTLKGDMTDGVKAKLEVQRNNFKTNKKLQEAMKVRLKEKIDKQEFDSAMKEKMMDIAEKEGYIIAKESLIERAKEQASQDIALKKSDSKKDLIESDTDYQANKEKIKKLLALDETKFKTSIEDKIKYATFLNDHKTKIDEMKNFKNQNIEFAKTILNKVREIKKNTDEAYGNTNTIVTDITDLSKTVNKVLTEAPQTARAALDTATGALDRPTRALEIATRALETATEAKTKVDDLETEAVALLNMASQGNAKNLKDKFKAIKNLINNTIIQLLILSETNTTTAKDKMYDVKTKVEDINISEQPINSESNLNNLVDDAKTKANEMLELAKRALNNASSAKTKADTLNADNDELWNKAFNDDGATNKFLNKANEVMDSFYAKITDPDTLSDNLKDNFLTNTNNTQDIYISYIVSLQNLFSKLNTQPVQEGGSNYISDNDSFGEYESSNDDSFSDNISDNEFIGGINNSHQLLGGAKPKLEVDKRNDSFSFKTSLNFTEENFYNLTHYYIELTWPIYVILKMFIKKNSLIKSFMNNYINKIFYLTNNSKLHAIKSSPDAYRSVSNILINEVFFDIIQNNISDIKNYKEKDYEEIEKELIEILDSENDTIEKLDKKNTAFMKLSFNQSELIKYLVDSFDNIAKLGKIVNKEDGIEKIRKMYSEKIKKILNIIESEEDTLEKFNYITDDLNSIFNFQGTNILKPYRDSIKKIDKAIDDFDGPINSVLIDELLRNYLNGFRLEDNKITIEFDNIEFTDKLQGRQRQDIKQKINQREEELDNLKKLLETTGNSEEE